jgi:hypothetical protein
LGRLVSARQFLFLFHHLDNNWVWRFSSWSKEHWRRNKDCSLFTLPAIWHCHDLYELQPRSGMLDYTSSLLIKFYSHRPIHPAVEKFFRELHLLSGNGAKTSAAVSLTKIKHPYLWNIIYPFFVLCCACLIYQLIYVYINFSTSIGRHKLKTGYIFFTTKPLRYFLYLDIFFFFSNFSNSLKMLFNFHTMQPPWPCCFFNQFDWTWNF